MPRLHPLLEPYRPTSDDPFDKLKAAHLLNRAGFGGTPDEIQRVVKDGPSASAERLLDFHAKSASDRSETDGPDLSSIEGLPKTFPELRRMFAGKNQEQRKGLRQQLMKANRQAIGATVGWWMDRMAFGPNPLQEKLTLFWHGHFTTSAKDERSASLMWEQNDLLRKMAAGNFREFVKSISRNPAMLDYLNNSQNRKGHPNENYARELMELFTLGIGNYTENDVKEAARAFTGWAHEGGDFVFRADAHDDGTKTFLGRTGNFNGDDIIELILAHPACPRYIAGQLFSFLSYDPDTDKGLRDGLASVLQSAKYELRPLLKTILTGRAFYSPKAMGSQIKSPVQLVVGTVRLLGMTMPPTEMLYGVLRQMGQVPLAPPNVKGWPGGHSWINASTIFVRYNTGVRLAAQAKLSAAAPTTAPADGPALANGATTNTAQSPSARIVRDWVSRLIQRPVDPAKIKILDEAMTAESSEKSLRAMVQLVLSMPEYQLC